jgi:Rhodopirellula transposase DDE domain
VVIGTTRETAAVAVAAIRHWWLSVGRTAYPAARRRLIEADGGGANGNRRIAWKAGLQGLADEFGLIISVTHYPPGASKWNPVEHRMFSLISENWAGEPLIDYETMLKFIRRTRSTTGLHCRACLDRRKYEKGVKVTREERATIRLKPRSVLPRWNYTIWPHLAGRKQPT